MKKSIIVLIFALSVCLFIPCNAKAEGTLSNAGYGAGSVLVSCVYSPAKVTYALLGGLTGGVAYGLTGGNGDVAKKIWTPSLRGTYVVTPDMLKGKEEVQFVGRSEGNANPTSANQAQQDQVQEDSLGK